MQLIDTHVHINFEVFQGDLDSLRQRWQQSGVSHLVHSCVEPGEFSSIQALANRFPELSFAIGLHPSEANKWTVDTGAQILNLATCDRRVVAIGEMGLDFYWESNPQYEQQKMVLEQQLVIANQLDLPVIIHCRNAKEPVPQDAAASIAEIFRQFNQKHAQPLRGVMHCWGGTPEETQWFLDLGFYISFSGIVTFKNAQAVQASAKMVPRDRLLVETDCPYLAPVPKRGVWPNEPAYVLHVAQSLAQLRQTSLETLAAQTTQNACNLFGFKV